MYVFAPCWLGCLCCYARWSRHAGSVAFALMCGCLCNDVMCSRHVGSVAAHCSKAAMFASARPPCRQSTRAVSRHQSSYKHRSCMRTNSNSTGCLCGDVFASESAAKSIPARTVMPMTLCNTSHHANDFLQRIPNSKKPMRQDKKAYPKTLAY